MGNGEQKKLVKGFSRSVDVPCPIITYNWFFDRTRTKWAGGLAKGSSGKIHSQMTLEEGTFHPSDLLRRQCRAQIRLPFQGVFSYHTSLRHYYWDGIIKKNPSKIKSNWTDNRSKLAFFGEAILKEDYLA